LNLCTPAEADRVAKGLHRYLGADLPAGELRELGWYDFLGGDRPITADPIEMALAAFLYLGVSEAGKYRMTDKLLALVCGFLLEMTGRVPTPEQTGDLDRVLAADPLDLGAVKGWFRTTYNPPGAGAAAGRPLAPGPSTPVPPR
jgi:hypothetical protein